MSKKLQSVEAAALLAAFVGSQENENQFCMMLERFEPFIKFVATKADRYLELSWREDLEEIGRIALMNAAREFPRDHDPNDFLGFALNSIRNSIIDFSRRESRYTKRIKPGLPGFHYVSDQTTHSVSDYTTSYSYEPGDRASPFNWTITSTLPVSDLFFWDHAAYKRIGLKDRDIKMWELHQHGYKIKEIAQSFGLSSGYCSTLLRKIRSKISDANK